MIDFPSFCGDALRILADASARSIVLALLVGPLLRACRVRNAAARHAAWSTVLCGMLLLPMLAPSLPCLAVPLLPASRVEAARGEGPAGQPNRPPIAAVPAAADAAVIPSAARPEATLRANTATLAPVESPARPPAIPWTTVLIVAYLAGVALMLGRLALGFALCRRLIRDGDFSAPARSLAEETCSPELRDRLRRARVTVGTSRATRVPLTFGWLRPAILLPEDWTSWGPDKLDAALAHELAHIERRDTVLMLVGAINVCVYWFHPLAWLLRHKLAGLAEQACDDRVIAWTGQRSRYARHLLEFASVKVRHRGRVAIGGLSMADGGDLRTRIAAILDRQRPIAGPLGRRRVVAIITGALLFVPALAAVHIRSRAAAEPVQVVESREPKPDGKGEDDPREVRVVHGRVLGPDGRPFVGALLSVPYQDSKGEAFLSKGRSGPDGRFRFRLSRAEFRDCDYDPFRQIRVAATAEGLGFGWDGLETPEGQPPPDVELTLRLVKDLPIEGRILTLEGKPVPGARLKLDFIEAFAGEDMTTYLRETRNGAGPVEAERSWYQAPPGRSNPITTDEQGRFRLDGVGRERVVRLELSGPGIGTMFVFAATRRPEAKEAALAWRPGWGTIYGATFDHLADPSRLIRGVVRDQETGKPLAGVEISTDRGPTLARSRTDAQGRFELSGYPKSPEYHVLATPAEGQPFFARHRELADTPGLGPLQLDFDLVRGVPVRGRLTDGETGKPVKGEVEYYPLFGNPHVESLGQPIAFRPYSRSVSGADGSYSLVVLPGPGVLAVAAWGGRWDRYLAARIDPQELKRVAPRASDANIDRFAPVALMGPVMLSNYNEMVLISPPDGAANPLPHDVALRVGRTLTVHAVGPDEEPLAGVRILGANSHQFDEIKSDAAGAFLIKALDPDEKRPLNLFEPSRNLGLYTTIPGDQAGPLSLRLVPCGSAFGRVLDEAGQPYRDRGLQVQRNGYIGTGNRSTRTDANGAFRVDGLVPGQPYRISYGDGRRSLYGEILVRAGEARDLGEARIEP